MRRMKGIIILCFVMLLSSCATSTTFTKQNMLDDYDYFWESIDNYYAFSNVTERESEIDIDDFKSEQREKIENGIDEEQFKNIMFECSQLFDGNGHLSYLDKGSIALYIATYEYYKNTNLGYGYLIDVLRQENVLNYYEVKEKDIEREAEKIKKGNIESDKKQPLGIECKILNEKSAYIKIDNFDVRNEKEGTQKILDFYKTIQTTPNLIIDIRGNGGGSSAYAMNAFITPNIEIDYEYKNYYLINKKGKDHPYFKAMLLKKEKEVPELIETNMNRDDYQLSGSLYSKKHVIESKDNHKAYQGKIYLLVDEGVYSSSEMFANIAKRMDFATLIGNTTGGDGIGTDPCLFSLPNSGLVYRFSIANGLNEDGSSNEEVGTIPDIEVGLYEDALEKTLMIINEGN